MNYSPDDIKKILKALEEEKPWDSPHIKDIKKRIKGSYLSEDSPKCCYCLRDFTGEFALVIDIEHILPKSIYKNCIFDLENLNIACKRCNMRIKKNDIKFITEDLQKLHGKWKSKYFNGRYYKIIHPNFDNVCEHMDIVYKRMNDIKFTKYFPKESSEKGKYTYEYFRLNELESDNFTEIQGGNVASKDTDLAFKVMNILKRHGL